MKILVAGGAGYIGSVLIPKLLARGYDIDVIDLLWFGNYLPENVNITRRELLTLTTDDLRGYDQVVFLAGLSNDPMAEYSPVRNFIENGSGPAYLAYIAKKAGVSRFIHGGSCSVYGYTVNELYDESSPTISNYPYGISKLLGEYGSMKLSDDTFSVIAFRQGTVSGSSPRMRFDLIVNTMFKFAVTEKKITVNNPSIWRPILAVQDAASAYVRAVEAPQQVSGIFNVASGNYTVGEVADYVRDGVAKYMNIDAHIDIHHIRDFRNYKVSTDKARNILSFKPRFTVEDIVHELVQHMHDFGDFSDDRFYNIKTFKSLYQTDYQPVTQ